MTEGPTGAERFTACAQHVVDYLNAHTPLGDWSVSRVAGGEQVHVHVHHQDVLDVGTRVDWPDTFCSRMLAGAAHVVPDSLADADYRELRLATELRAYAGVPISNDDGSLFGVLCGIGADPVPDLDRGTDGIDPDLLTLLSGLLSEQLACSRQLDGDRRQLEIAEALSNVDGLTGLLNRRGWDALVADAQRRVDAFGDLVSVAVIDLDGLKRVNDRQGHHAGDELLRRAAGVLRDNVRTEDRLARYGGDEFAVLADDVPVAELGGFYRRLCEALTAAGVAASVGWAPTGPGVTVIDSFALADRRMYDMKRRSRVPTGRDGHLSVAAGQ